MANPEGGGHGVQLPLKREGIQEYFVFYAGSYPIYILNSGKAAPTQDFEAIRIEGEIAGLNAYESITPIHLFYRDKQWVGHYITKSVGTKFGAFSKKAYKRKT